MGYLHFLKGPLEGGVLSMKGWGLSDEGLAVLRGGGGEIWGEGAFQ